MKFGYPMENRGERRFQVRNIIKIDEIPIDTSSGNRGSVQLYIMLHIVVIRINRRLIIRYTGHVKLNILGT